MTETAVAVTAKTTAMIEMLMAVTAETAADDRDSSR
jgi:hypothetical protein